MSWHAVEKFAEDTYRIYEPMGSIPSVGLATVNMFLLVGEERAALIDSGMGIGDARSVVDQITSLPCEVLNTHSHWDHVGANAAFEQTAIHELEAEIVSRDHEIFPPFLHELRSPSAIDLLPDSFDLDTYGVRPNSPTRTLREGDVIELGGRQLKALHTPGHSPGHLTYLDAERGFLFTGDVAYPGPVFGAYWGGGPDVFAATVARLADLPGPLVVCGGHNDVAKDPAWLGWFASCVQQALSGRASCTLRDEPVGGRVFTFGDTAVWFPLLGTG